MKPNVERLKPVISYSESAKEVIKMEAMAIARLSEYLDGEFDQTIELLLRNKGRLVITGIGKSGLIGRKIVATLSSTGTPSVFLHPTEAFHGDLGMITSKDIVLAISYSGETTEILQLIPYFKKKKISIISITGNENSSLAIISNFHLKVNVLKEAGPLDLAPTSSTTATLVMGDALAMVLMRAKNIKPEDFALYHPGGSLGKRLLTHVRDVMFKDNLPVLSSKAPMKKVIEVITTGKLGLVVIVNKNRVRGIITDGDLRRFMNKKGNDFFKFKAKSLMTKSPKKIHPDKSLREAELKMLKYKITSLLVIENKDMLGVIDLYHVK